MSEQKIAELVAAGKNIGSKLPKSLKLSAQAQAIWETLRDYKSAELSVVLTVKSGWTMRSGLIIDLLKTGILQVRHTDGTTSSIHIEQIGAITV